MTLTLIDFAGKKVKKNIGNINDIAKIDIEVISGDEVAIVLYKDYTTKSFDSSDERIIDYHDYYYELYHFRNEKNVIDDPKWKNRKSSYDIKWREL